MILVGPLVVPESGFRTGDAKIAFLRGDVVVDAAVPPEVVGLLRSSGTTAVAGGGKVPPLVLDRAERGATEFSTDRGRRRLAAWSFGGSELLGPLWVLDPDVAAARWEPAAPAELAAPGVVSHLFHRGQIDADERTLHLQFTGPAPEWVDYPSTEVFESFQAVTAVPHGHDHGPSRPRRAVGHLREVVITLADPLGNRVVINLDGSPVEVTSLEPTGAQRI
ncbi:MAG TPA: hypothetical protein VGR90_06595 [Acidimicrobiales bacterium]|nr:hypothetical protein [Acidimicrobiales bacterium]